MISRYVSPSEFRRLLSALLVVAGFIAIAALFAFLIVPGLRHGNEPTAEVALNAPQGETGWLDPTDYPPTRREVLPPVDPATLITPSPALLARGRQVYDRTCASCHGATGKGNGPGAGQLNPKPRDFTAAGGWKNGTRIEDLFRTLAEGLKGTSMVAYTDLTKKDRMALVHAVQTMGAFDHGASDPKARAALEALFASAGEVIPNKIPVRTAEALLLREAQTPPVLDAARNPILKTAMADPRRVALVLAARPQWLESDAAMAQGVLAGLPANGFAPVVATWGADQWKALRAALAAR